eukprot:g77969.t1
MSLKEPLLGNQASGTEGPTRGSIAKAAGFLSLVLLGAAGYGRLGAKSSAAVEPAAMFGAGKDSARCVFLYSDNVPESLSKNLTVSDGFINNAKKTAITNVATQTSSPDDVLNGKLLCVKGFFTDFAPTLKEADKLLGYTPEKEQQGGIKRSITQVHAMDGGQVQKAYWYYQKAGVLKTRNRDMTVAMFGCTGGTGIATMAKLLKYGNKVICLVRNATRLPDELRNNPRVFLVIGNATDPLAVSNTVQGSDAVVVVLGPGSKGKDAKVCSEAQPLINAALNQNNPEERMVVVTSMGVEERMVVVTSMGVGSSYKHLSFITKLLVSTILRGPIADKNKQEETVEREIRNYILVRPGGLKNGNGTGTWEAAEDIKSGSIPREDVAAFIVDEALGTDKWRRQGVTVVSAPRK